MMRIVFRVDASTQIGTGHVIRCMTLAAELRSRGAQIAFACRDLPGNLCDTIREAGFKIGAEDLVDRGGWDWLVVDHYGLESRYEASKRGSARRVMVIDDVADRAHDCDLLLDQN